MNEFGTSWRRCWQTGVDGITYGTHSLGPILQWMPGDRVARVCCEGTGVRHPDHTGNPYCQASSTMLCKTEKDALIKIRVDGQSEITAAEGDGPVNAMDRSLRKALDRFYPTLAEARLTDYKVRVLNGNAACKRRGWRAVGTRSPSIPAGGLGRRLASN